MPIISRFFGIVIMMFWRDHAPAHFHAKYGDEEVIVEIESGKTQGAMSSRALGLVHEWRLLHQDQLMLNWNLACEKKALIRIQPLE